MLWSNMYTLQIIAQATFHNVLDAPGSQLDWSVPGCLGLAGHRGWLAV